MNSDRIGDKSRARSWYVRVSALAALLLLVLWVYKLDAYVGLGAGQVTGPTMMSWSRPFRRGAGYGTRYYYLAVAGQSPDEPHEFNQFAPGALEKAKALFKFDESQVTRINRCTIHYAGIWKHVVTDIEIAN